MCFENATEIILGISYWIPSFKQKNSRLSKKETDLSLILGCVSTLRSPTSAVEPVLLQRVPLECMTSYTTGKQMNDFGVRDKSH